MAAIHKASTASDRRTFMKRVAQAGIGLGVLGLSTQSKLFMEQAHGVTPTNEYYDACVQIFLRGGPSQTDTVDPKPGSANNVFNTVNLGTQDVYGEDFHVSEVLQNIANMAINDPAIGLGAIRSVTHSSNNHEQGRKYMFSFWQGSLADSYPTMAPVMQHYYKGHPFGVPSVVIEDGIGRRGVQLEANLTQNSRLSVALQVSADNSGQGGDPVLDSLKLPPNVNAARYQRRKALLDKLQDRYMVCRDHPEAVAWKQANEDAFNITSNGAAAQAFDLSGVPLIPASSASISRRLTLQTRLIESGVPFVLSGMGGSDTHRNNREGHERIWGQDIDLGVGEMITRLKATGKRVLIVICGEFGRTPNSVRNGRNGRDHWGDGFSVALVSVNQPKFKTTAYGDTGPDGEFRAATGTLVDEILPKDIGAFIYRAMGFQIGDQAGLFNIPMRDRSAPPVDRTNQANKLLNAFGLV
jgi:hypothetical protein